MTPRLEDLIGHLEHPLGGPFRNRVPLAPPVLHVATALLDPGETQGRTADQSHRLGLTLTQRAGRQLAVGLEPFGGMAEQHMGQLVEAGLVRQRVHWVDRYGLLLRKAQTVPVGLVKRDLLHVQGGQGPILVPRGDLRLG